MDNIDIAAVEAAHLIRSAKLNEVLQLQDEILALTQERKRLDLPYSSEFWKYASGATMDFAQLDLMLEQTREGVARCREITEQQKRAAGK